VQLLSKSLDQIKDESWFAECGDAFIKHIPLFANIPEEKVSVLYLHNTHHTHFFGHNPVAASHPQNSLPFHLLFLLHFIFLLCHRLCRLLRRKEKEADFYSAYRQYLDH